jgi:transcriptional regulator with XRE-family HTH domain
MKRSTEEFFPEEEEDLPEDDDSVKVAEKIKQIREQKGMSLQDLAAKCGFSSALLSQLENHMVSPPLGTLIKIARALEVEIGAFFQEMHDVPYTIVRHDERKAMSRVASKQGVKYGYSYESLAFDKKGRHMEPFLVTLEPATKKDRHAYSHEGEEFIFVLEGRMEVQLGEHTDVLEPGDSIYFDSTVPHRVQCQGDENAKILACLYMGEAIK